VDFFTIHAGVLKEHLPLVGSDRSSNRDQRLVEALLDRVEHLKNRDGVMEASIQVKHFEEEADSIYHHAIGQLFDAEQDARELIKWKEIYDNLERCVDQAEDVANVLEKDIALVKVGMKVKVLPEAILTNPLMARSSE
jgi:hypothetical protein